MHLQALELAREALGDKADETQRCLHAMMDLRGKMCVMQEAIGVRRERKSTRVNNTAAFRIYIFRSAAAYMHIALCSENDDDSSAFLFFLMSTVQYSSRSLTGSSTDTCQHFFKYHMTVLYYV